MNRITIPGTIFLLFSSITLFGQSNAFKVGFSDAYLGNFNLNYERVLSSNNSLLFKLGYMEPTLSPFIGEKAITPSAFTLEESKGGMNSSLEYRFYMTGEKALQGIYIAPYLRFLNQKIDYSDEIDTRLFSVDFRLNTLGIGAQLGYQLYIGEHILIDFYFFGAGMDYHMVSFKHQLKQQLPGFDYGTVINDVNDVFKDIKYLHKRLKYDDTNENLTTKLPFFFPGFRLGINIGIAF